jgi:hypothetical protein
MKEKNAFADGHLFQGWLQCLLIHKKNAHD